MRLLSSLLLSTALCFASLPAAAQSPRDVADRMEKLERDLMVLQRQMARGGIAPATGDSSLSEGGAAAEVKLSAVEEEIRSLRGKVEENEFQVRKLTEEFAKLQKDMDFRLTALEQRGMQSAPGDAPKDLNAGETDRQTPEGNTAIADGTQADSDVKQDFASARDHYNYAFRLLNQTRYEDAGKSFTAFITQYPKDPLIGNAYYWLGETYYIRRDYVKAADNFRAGFEALPAGPKAADNLLKLAMSLNALKNTKDACTVLSQIVVKFKDNSSTVAKKAEQERERIGCK